MTNIPKDKLLHIIVGFMIFIMAWVVLETAAALVLVFVAGTGKEIYDYFHPNHTCDIWDAIATYIGGAIGFSLLALLK
jgi:VanZ family protein